VQCIQKTEGLTTARLREAEKAHFATVCSNTNQPKKTWMELNNLMGKQYRQPIRVISNNDGEAMNDKHMAFNEYLTGLCVGDTAVRKQLQVGSAQTEGVFQFSTIIYS